MFVLEKLISLLAPHYCISCGEEGALVCEWCLPDFCEPLPDRCFACKKATDNSLVCANCRRTIPLKHVWVRSDYGSYPKQLIHDFKFERKQAAAVPVARLIAESLPFLPPETIVTHVPTATSRVRKRGYDQSKLIAEELAKIKGLQHRTLLRRVTQTRQVRSTRKERIKQMERAFEATQTDVLNGAKILLIDDLTTTGATLQAAADCLKQATPKSIDAAVFAQKQ